jgi:hypothetical protein
VAELRGDVAALRAEFAALSQRLAADLLPVLRLLAGRDTDNRRLLGAARATGTTSARTARPSVS